LGRSEKSLNGERTLRCSLCGKSFNDIVESGRVGCAECYVTFYDKLLPTLRKIHGKTTHQGKIPTDFTENKSNSIRDIDELKKALKEAIEKEEFELAATLRDEINALSGGAF
jgi:protein arginine kinase activator